MECLQEEDSDSSSGGYIHQNETPARWLMTDQNGQLKIQVEKVAESSEQMKGIGSPDINHLEDEREEQSSKSEKDVS
jgi:hypothetical protein